MSGRNGTEKGFDIMEGQKTFKPAMEGTSNSTVSMMGWCRGGWNNDSGSGW